MKRCLAIAVVVLASPVAFAQSPEVVAKVEAKLATIKFINSLYDPATGGFKVTADGKPSLRACNGAAKALSILGAKLPDRDKTAAFVLACYDPKTGAFAEPGGKPDVTITSIGVMVAMELGIPKAKFEKVMRYLDTNMGTFEDCRIVAAALEAWGVKELPELQKGLVQLAQMEGFGEVPGHDDDARHAGAVIAMALRLGGEISAKELGKFVREINKGQHPDGGWGKVNENKSDLDSTYRVMRAFMLMKQKPANLDKVKAFVEKCRNKDGGAGVKPGEPSSMSGVYYTTIISKWVANLEK